MMRFFKKLKQNKEAVILFAELKRSRKAIAILKEYTNKIFLMGYAVGLVVGILLTKIIGYL